MKNLSSDEAHAWGAARPEPPPLRAVQAFVYHDCNAAGSAGPFGDGEPEDGEAESASVNGEEHRAALEAARQMGYQQAHQQLGPEATRQAETAMRAELERHTQAQLQRITRTLDEFRSQREEYFRQLEREVVQLTLAIARKVLRREAQIDPLLLAGTVHVALEPLAIGVPVTLAVPPSALGEWQELLGREDHPLAELRADPTLEPFGCRLETETGSTDLSLESQLHEIEQGFLDLMRRRTAIAAHA